MLKRYHRILTVMALALGALVTGACGDMGSDSGHAVAPPAPDVPPSVEPLKIEESDLYRLDGELLYVQNPDSGLNVIDVSDPRQPQLLGQADVVGAAGELYLRREVAIVLLEEATAACAAPSGCGRHPVGSARAEAAFVDVSQPRAPRLIERYCIPGELVASRLVGDFLIVVTNDSSWGGSRAYSVDVSDPARARVVQQMDFPAVSQEIHVTSDAIYVAGPTNAVPRGCSWCTATNTEVQLIGLDASNGKLTRRGSMVLHGEPQGRFHMDAHERQFRIVTYDTIAQRSVLHVLDVSEPDDPRLLGGVGIGAGERLYATRFAGERAYVVTFRRTDPLWVVDLSVPSAPRVVGELWVPGWSDFIFPRGDRLLCIGRGDGGSGVGVSLFDVSDPSAPRVVDQLTVGQWDAQSAANIDHRAVTIVERERALPFLIVPYSNITWDWYWNGGRQECEQQSYVQLIDIGRESLRQRGAMGQVGAVRRTMVVEGDVVLSISNYELQAVDIEDRDHPRATARLTLGDLPDPAEYCVPGQPDDVGWDDVDEQGPFYYCNVGPEPGPPSLSLLLLGLAALLRRRRRR